MPIWATFEPEMSMNSHPCKGFVRDIVLERGRGSGRTVSCKPFEASHSGRRCSMLNRDAPAQEIVMSSSVNVPKHLGLGRTLRAAVVATVAASALFMGGCNNAVEGGLSGAGLGALGGMAIGSLTGDMGKGAVVGAVLGGVGGALVGDQNQRSDQRNSRYRDEIE